MKTPAYLATVPDDVKMTREEFVKLLRRFKHHHSVKFGFSAKHTKDILEYRKEAQTNVAGVYNIPVTYNTDVTYVV